MRKRKYLIGAFVGVLGALTFSSVAQAGSPTAMSEQATILPAKQSVKTFGGASLHNVITWTYSNFLGTHQPRTTTFLIDPNVKLVPGNIPVCQQSQIQNKPDAQARAACPQSIFGQGTVEVNNGALKGVVTFFSAGPKTMFLQTDINNGSVIITITGQISGRTLTFTGVPDTVGLVLTKFDTTFNKRKTGKNTFYVMARCKKKKWTTSTTSNFYSGETTSASSTQKCKQKK
jgi:hypothetical protein